jgi:hypothetical protein
VICQGNSTKPEKHIEEPEKNNFFLFFFFFFYIIRAIKKLHPLINFHRRCAYVVCQVPRFLNWQEILNGNNWVAVVFIPLHPCGRQRYNLYEQ